MSSNESQDPNSNGGAPKPVPRKRTKLPQIKVENPGIDLSIIIKINDLLKKKTDQFSQQLNNCIDSFDSVENLVEISDIYIQQLIAAFKKECDLSEGQFLESFLIRLKGNTNKILNDLKIIIENREHVTKCLSTEQLIDSDINNKPTPVIRTRTTVSNANAVSSSIISSPPMINQIRNEINHQIYEEIPNNQKTITSKSETPEINSEVEEQDHSVNFDCYLRLYRNRLKDSIDYRINEKDIQQIHRELRLEFIQMFHNNENGTNVFALGQELDKCFSDFRVKLLEKQANVEKCLKKAKSVYTHGMDECFKNNKFYSDETLSQLQKDWEAKALEFLNINFEQTFDSEDFDSYELSQELIEEINEEFEKYKDKNELSRFHLEKILDSNLNDCSDFYDKQLQSLLDTVENQNELLDKNESLRKEMFENFKIKNFSFDQDILETSLIKLDKCLKKSFEGADSLLDLRLRKQRENCRQYYKQQMEMKFEIKKFYFQKTLISFHENIVRELTKNFNISSNLVQNFIRDIFNEFNERNARNTPKEPAIGIDLGTTNSCVAYFTPDLKSVKSTVVLQNELGKDITPSVVSFRANNEIVVGNVAKEEDYNNPQNTIHSVKRFIGKTFSDLTRNKINEKFMENLEYKLVNIDNKPKICLKVDGIEKQYFPEEISAKVLKKLKLISEKYLEQFKVKKVVITVPAYFNESQKEATKQAGLIAGLEVLRVINEPTAAAIAFKIDQNIDMSESTILIFDFGGGTLDVAIVRLEQGNIIVKTVKGDNYLGGDDIDNNLIDYCLNEFRKKTGKVLTKKELPIHRLRRVCEESKINLSSVYSTKIWIKNFYQDFDLLVELTRTKFDEINKDIFEKSIDLVKDAMKDAKLKYTDINHIVLVGGSTRIPKILKMLSKLFNNRALNHTIDPDKSVAIGAAIHAATLNGQSTQEQMFKFTDVTSMSLGVKNSKNELLVLIRRNTQLPTNITKTFKTSENNQKSVKIVVFEGEERTATDNQVLGEFELDDIPIGKKGDIEILVTFEMNAEGILTVSAKCDKSESKIVIKEHKCKLTEEQMEELFKKGELEKEEEHKTWSDARDQITGKIKKVFTFRGLPKPLVKADDFELK